MDRSYAWTAAVRGPQVCVNCSCAWTVAVCEPQPCVDHSSAWTAAVRELQLCVDSSWACIVMLNGIVAFIVHVDLYVYIMLVVTVILLVTWLLFLVGMIIVLLLSLVVSHEAGKAELSLSIVSPTGKTIPYDIVSTSLGERVTYIPSEAGPHNIYITYGGLEVPGKRLTNLFSP